jgi:predicted amidohydrolase
MHLRLIAVCLLMTGVQVCSFTITVFQPKIPSLTPTKAGQLAALDIAAKAAGHAGANVLMVPELYLTGYNLAAFPLAESATGPSLLAVKKMCVAYNISILFTYPEKDEAALNGSGAVYDSAALIHRNGTVVSSYRKVNLAAGESQFLTAGTEFAPVIELDGVRVGILICFDIFLPEPARILALSSAQIILVPTANGYPFGANTLTNIIVPSRAFENNAAVAYVNWVQDEPSFPPFLSFHGQTTVSDGNLQPLFAASPNESVVEHVFVNTTSLHGGGTAIGRRAADLKHLCDP